MRLDVPYRRALGAGNRAQGADLIEHQIRNVTRLDRHLPAAEAVTIVK